MNELAPSDRPVGNAPRAALPAGVVSGSSTERSAPRTAPSPPVGAMRGVAAGTPVSPAVSLASCLGDVNGEDGAALKDSAEPGNATASDDEPPLWCTTSRHGSEYMELDGFGDYITATLTQKARRMWDIA